MIAMGFEAQFKQQAALKHLDANFTKRALKRAENKALRAAKDEALRLYRKTVQTWNFPPQFSAIRRTEGYTIMVSDIRYRYLDSGTKVRYATMTKGFVPKTKVGVMYSYQGAGRLAYVNKRKPRPGIQARGWSLEVYRRVGIIIRRVWREEMGTAWRF